MALRGFGWPELPIFVSGASRDAHAFRMSILQFRLLQARPEQRWIHPAFAWTSLFGRAVALDELWMDPRLA